MPSLPLKVQVAIRDHWSKEDAPLSKALSSLKETLGYGVDVDPEWQLLLGELEQFYPDKGQFVVTVAGCVEAWCRSMTELLEDEGNEEWSETLLERLNSRLRLFVDVSPSERASTSWSKERMAFVLSLPKRSAVNPAELYPVFRGGLLSCFKAAAPASTDNPSTGGNMMASTAADDWADVEMDSKTGKPEIIDSQPSSVIRSSRQTAPKSEYMPSAIAIPRPDELLLQPPYHLLISYSRAGNEVEVQCSHSPTLKFLADYFKRFSRVNHQDTRNPPAVTVSLQQSAFGLGLLFDRLTLMAENRYTNQFSASPTIVLALVEGPLGYNQVSSYGECWTYRRDVAFKN